MKRGIESEKNYLYYFVIMYCHLNGNGNIRI
jgi:hypothetical protein